MVQHRVRIRFRKEGDLRFLGHRDVSRALERTFRRAGIPVAMSQGMRPKPRIMFPSALAVGVAGTDEVVEIDLTDAWSAERVGEALEAHSPPGWRFDRIEIVEAPGRAATARKAEFSFPVPDERRAAAAEAVVRFVALPEVRILREEGGRSLDLKAFVPELSLVDGVLRFSLLMSADGQARPREVLEALGVADLEQEGFVLTRTKVDLE